SELRRHLHNGGAPRLTMGPRPTVVALIVLLMSSTLAGCIGLVPAREFLETRRDSVETVTVYDRVAFAHTFTNLVETYSNSSSFYVDESVTQIDVYFKASFVASDSVGCLDAGGTLRYVQATLTDSEGGVLWSTDVCEDANPPEESYFAQPEFAGGEWILTVEAQGGGERFLNQFKDNFNIVVTIHRNCMKYPLEDSC
ncbi:MAG: hypothetical protein VXX03_06070, partial [Candidatus Thermoplasmatota archaeon]|nr:hypothetical protein [Candidatus Thermoplasmatota archaeon]